MARGLWRWWTEKDGADTWWARVEIRRGEWTDVEAGEYERAGHQPPFWELPLHEDYLASIVPEPLPLQMQRAELQMMPTFIIAIIIAGGLAVTLIIVAFDLFHR